MKILSLRRLSCIIGRGAFGLNTSKTILNDELSIPAIKLSAFFEKDHSKIDLEKTDEDFKELCNWPKFHNGVAIGLEISREMSASLDNETIRTWIKYQKIELTTKPKEYENPGLIFGFGL